MKKLFLTKQTNISRHKQGFHFILFEQDIIQTELAQKFGVIVWGRGGLTTSMTWNR
jgi:hypothetical protein